MGARSKAIVCLRRGYAAVSAVVSLAIVLALARAGNLVGEAAGKSCGDMWDIVRWTLMVASCRLSDVDFPDIVNGGIVLLTMLASLIPFLLILRIALLILVAMYLSGIIQARTIGHNFAGLELWWVPISYLSILILIVAIVTAVFRFAKRWRGLRGAARRDVT